jgi:Ser/Thr protein kinase RdoA (MazF antagonist)
VASVAFRVPGNPRVSLLAMDAAGRPIAFAKLLNAPQPHVAAAASALLSRAPTRSFGIPLALDEGEFSGRLYRVLRPLPEGPHRPPPLDPARLADVVDEFHERLSELERPPGTPAGHVACHADLTPRNLRVASDGGWWLFDWDNVRFGPRLADELRYWCAWHAYRPKPSVERDSAAVLSLLRRRGSDSEIAEAVAWPEQVRQTYREIEPRLHAAVGAAVGAAP